MLVNKPAGLLTQAVPGIDSLQTRLVQQLKDRDAHTGTPFVGLPHRLDRGTSGVVLIARNQRALKRFGDQFHHRWVQKYYLAWVHGEMSTDVQQWSDHLRKIDDQPQVEIVAADTPGAKLAEMLVHPICIADGFTLAMVRLLTGRMHQIRIQFASRGAPVVGDALYGSSLSLLEKEDPRQQPHGLHALRLEFRHPQTARPVSATAPLPDYWSASPTIGQAAGAWVARSQAESATTWNWPLAE